jgi:hypothetical protein
MSRALYLKPITSTKKNRVRKPKILTSYLQKIYHLDEFSEVGETLVLEPFSQLICWLQLQKLNWERENDGDVSGIHVYPEKAGMRFYPEFCVTRQRGIYYLYARVEGLPWQQLLSCETSELTPIITSLHKHLNEAKVLPPFKYE